MTDLADILKRKENDMGVYIPNMSKPLTCDECIVPLSRCDYLQGRAIKCPLIEIDDEAIDIAQDIIDGCKRFKERRTDE